MNEKNPLTPEAEADVVILKAKKVKVKWVRPSERYAYFILCAICMFAAISAVVSGANHTKHADRQFCEIWEIRTSIPAPKPPTPYNTLGTISSAQQNYLIYQADRKLEELNHCQPLADYNN